MLHRLHECTLPIVLVPNAFKCLCICGLIPSNQYCQALVMPHHSLHMGGMEPTTLVVIHMRSSMIVEVNVTKRSLGTFGVSPMATQSQSIRCLHAFLPLQSPFVCSIETTPQVCLRLTHSWLHGFDASNPCLRQLDTHACLVPR